MVSGVGPASVLQSLHIPVVADLPGVGQDMWVSHSSIRQRFGACPRLQTLITPALGQTYANFRINRGSSWRRPSVSLQETSSSVMPASSLKLKTRIVLIRVGSSQFSPRIISVSLPSAICYLTANPNLHPSWHKVNPSAKRKKKSKEKEKEKENILT